MARPGSGAADPAGAVPALAVLVDYDGTIATTDISDELVRSNSSAERWDDLERSYHAGDMGSRRALQLQAALLPGDASGLGRILAAISHDVSFLPFLESVRRLGAHVEVVSDGLGFFVEEALTRLGASGLPVFSAAVTFDGRRAQVRFPHGHPECRVCGTCKRERVLVHRAHGCHVVFVGDGFSDLYASAHADTVLAKGLLADLCSANEVPYTAWESFRDVGELVARLVRDGVPQPRIRPLRCGPEAWGPAPWIPGRLANVEPA